MCLGNVSQMGLFFVFCSFFVVAFWKTRRNPFLGWLCRKPKENPPPPSLPRAFERPNSRGHPNAFPGQGVPKPLECSQRTERVRTLKSFQNRCCTPSDIITLARCRLRQFQNTTKHTILAAHVVSHAVTVQHSFPTCARIRTRDSHLFMFK